MASPRKIYINSYKRNLYESFEITKQQKTSVCAFGARKIITINLLVTLGFYNQDPCPVAYLRKMAPMAMFKNAPPPTSLVSFSSLY